MIDRRRDDRIGNDGHTHRLARVRWLGPKSTDWPWLDSLCCSDLDSDFIEAVGERVEDQEHSLLESLFD